VWLERVKTGEERAFITFPKANSERLMLAPSRKRAPLAFVALALSEPARSIRLILATQALGLRLALNPFITPSSTTLFSPKTWSKTNLRSLLAFLFMLCLRTPCFDPKHDRSSSLGSNISM
uniref:Uncharacterized protein n=1 Tax=Cynoglossus semilaevis TaxID=244447 RepID=A0A3P8UMU4_CYNSE